MQHRHQKKLSYRRDSARRPADQLSQLWLIRKFEFGNRVTSLDGDAEKSQLSTTTCLYKANYSTGNPWKNLHKTYIAKKLESLGYNSITPSSLISMQLAPKPWSLHSVKSKLEHNRYSRSSKVIYFRPNRMHVWVSYTYSNRGPISHYFQVITASYFPTFDRRVYTPFWCYRSGWTLEPTTMSFGQDKPEWSLDVGCEPYVCISNRSDVIHKCVRQTQTDRQMDRNAREHAIAASYDAH